MISTMVAAAAAFDVEAATRAYLTTLDGAARAKSDAYFEGGYWLPLWATLVAVGSAWLMLRLGWSRRWSDWAGRVTGRPFLRAMLYTLPYLVVGALITLPWSIYADFLREHQYGLSNQSFGEWLGDQGKAMIVSLVLVPLFVAIIYTVIRKSPRRWWLWGTGATVAMLLLAVMIAPVFIAPLFNKYTPMPDGALRTEILAMAHAQQIPADNVYVVDASKQTKRISANVSGLGPTIRISLNDNLLNRGTEAEVKAVMGHEMGHYVLGHILRNVAFMALISLLALLACWWAIPRILARHGARWKVTDVADPASLPLLAAIFSVVMLALGPVSKTIIRTAESEADAFGLDAARQPDGFASTAMKLSEYRKIEPSAVEEYLFYDHPSGRTRVRMAMEWKARHLAELPADQQAMVTPPPMGEGSAF